MSNTDNTSSTETSSKSTLGLANRDGLSTINLVVSGDHYLGAPQFRVWVDGQVASEIFTVTAIRGSDDWEEFTLRGDFGQDGPRSVQIEFLNDRYEGSGKDRNLAVQSVNINGKSYAPENADYERGYDGQQLEGRSVMAWSGKLGFDTLDAGGPNWVNAVEDQAFGLDLEIPGMDSGFAVADIVIAGLPEGAKPSAGERDDFGNWVIKAEDAEGLTITPPTNMSGQLDIKVAARGTDTTSGAERTETLGVTVRVEGVSDSAVVSSTGISGAEDSAMMFDLTATLQDSDGSEIIESIIVDGMPGGSTFSAGQLTSDGKWSLQPEDLEGLTFQNTQHSDSDYTLSVAVTSREIAGGKASTTLHNVDVKVDAVADGVTLQTADELSVIRLRISGEGFESGNELFAGPPEFRVFVNGEVVGGTQKANSEFRKDEWEVFTITGDFGQSGPASVEVEFTNDLWCKPNCADRNLLVDWIEVNGHTYQSETDSRYLRYEIKADGGAEHCDEFGNPIPNGSETSTGYQAETWMSARERMNWEGKLVFDTSTNGGPRGAWGKEDTAIALILDAALIDSDGSENIAEIVFNGVPEGALLSSGIDRGNGTWSVSVAELDGLTVTPPKDSDNDFELAIDVVTVEAENGNKKFDSATLSVTVEAVADAPGVTAADVSGTEGETVALDIGAALTDIDSSESLAVVISGMPAGSKLSAGAENADGTWTLEPGQLEGVKLTPPQNVSGEIKLVATGISTEAANGDQARNDAAFTVTLAGIAGEPDVTVRQASGNEDSTFALDIDVSTADVNEVVTVRISNVPQGASLSAGTQDENGDWNLSAAELENLTITPAEHSDTNFDLSVAVTSTQKDTGDRATKIVTLPVAVEAVADAPVIANEYGDGLTSEINLTVSGQHYLGEPKYQVFINGEQHGGTYTVTADHAKGESESLTISGQFGIDGPKSVEVKFLNDRWEGPGKDRNLVIEGLEVNGTQYKPQDSNYNRAYDNANFDGMPIMYWSGSLTWETVGNDGPAGVRGYEDKPIDLGLEAVLTDRDGSESIESVIISKVPAGAILSHGIDNGDGTWTLSAEEFSSASITAPADSNENMMLGVTAVSKDSNGDTAKTEIDLPVRVRGVADTPDLTTENSEGVEDTPVAVNFGGALSDIDGSETLSYLVSQIPEGASLNQGIRLEDGTWELQPADLENLTITPPNNFSGEIKLGVKAIATENDGDVASTDGVVIISVDARADAAVITRKTAKGNEDGQIALSIDVATSDTDGSERIGAITLSGIPTGSVLSAGIDNGDGSWTMTSDDLEGLYVVPPKDSNDDFKIKITAETIETNGDTTTTSRSMMVRVKGVADAPAIAAVDATGDEDKPIDLQLNAELVDTDGSETLAVSIAGVPAGASLSSGTQNSDGTWTVNAEDLVDLTITAPRNFSGRMDLELHASTVENDGNASHSAMPFSVNVRGIADRAHLDIRPAKGLEDNEIALDIRSSLIDGDGSETLSFIIDNMPEGAKLSAGTAQSDGTWSLTATEVAGLTVTPPKDSNEDFTLAVTAITTETDGDVSRTTLALPVTVTGVADTPLAVANEVTGDEDTVIKLDLKADLADIDGSEQVSIVIDGLPLGARLSHGLYNGNGTWSIDPKDLSDLSVTPPRDYSGKIDMSMRVISTENDGDATSVTLPFTINVKGVVDTPGGLSETVGLEDTAVGINIVPKTTDIDGSESVVSAVVKGVPADAKLSAGTEVEPGIWKLDPSEFSGLKVLPGYNSNVDFKLEVEVTVQEKDGAASTYDRFINVDMVGDADTPDVWATDVAGRSNTPIALDFDGALNDTDGSEHLYFIIEDIPKGTYINNGFNNGDGTWTVLKSHLDGLTATSPHNYRGDIDLTVRAVSRENDGDIASNTTTFKMSVDYDTSGNGFYFFGLEDNNIGFDVSSLEENGATEITISELPEGVEFSAGKPGADGTWTVAIEDTPDLRVLPTLHSDDDMQLTLSWNDGTGATRTAPARVEVLGVADTPTIEMTAEDAFEDTPFSISLSGELIDTDGSEKLSFVVKDLPEGSSLTAGYLNPMSNVWTLTPDDLEGLQITPPEDFSGELNFSIGSVSTERSGDYAVNTRPVSVNIEAVADDPEIGGTPEAGTEDKALDLNLSIESTDDDGSESIVAVTISDLPTGASLINATDNADGTWTVDPQAVDSVQIIPPQHAHGTFSVTVTATSEEPNGSQATNSGKVNFYVASEPDEPTVVASDVSGNEDETIALNLSANLVDTDGSEVMSVRLDGIPDGATLSAGFNNGDGTWTVTGDQLNGLSLNPPADFSGELKMGITGVTMEMDTGHTAQTPTLPFKVDVRGVADAPTIDPQAAVGIENNAIPVVLGANLTDTDGSENLSVVFSDFPEGATFSSGEAVAGGWLVDGQDLNSLTVTPPVNSDVDFEMGIEVISTETSGDTASVTDTVKVSITATANGADVVAEDVTGSEDSAIDLNMSARLIDIDGSEILEATVTGVPAGGSLSHGVANGDGSWNINPVELPDVKMTPPENFSGNVEMTLITTTTEKANGSQVISTKRFNVEVEGVADAPTLMVADANGMSDSEIALDIASSLTDLDGSESLSVRISGVPADANLSQGTRNQDGTWTLAASMLPGLAVTPATGFSGDIDLDIEAIATEDNANASATTASMKVTVTEPEPEQTPVVMAGGGGAAYTAPETAESSDSGDSDSGTAQAAASSSYVRAAASSAFTVQTDNSDPVQTGPAAVAAPVMAPAAASASVSSTEVAEAEATQAQASSTQAVNATQEQTPEIAVDAIESIAETNDDAVPMPAGSGVRAEVVPATNSGDLIPADSETQSVIDEVMLDDGSTQASGDWTDSSEDSAMAQPEIAVDPLTEEALAADAAAPAADPLSSDTVTAEPAMPLDDPLAMPTDM